MKHIINLLLFSVRNVVFGVYAEHVQELLKTESTPVIGQFDNSSIRYKEHELPIIDFSQWLQLDKLSNSKLSCVSTRQGYSKKIRLFDEEQKGVSTLEASSRILVIHHRTRGYIGVRIEHPKKLIAISIAHIHTLPVIMQKNKQIQAVWGIAFVDNTPIILIDLEQL